VVTVVLLIVAVEAIRSIIKNPNFKWHVVGQFFTTNAVLKGLLVTLELTVLAMVLGITIGVILAVMRQSPSPIVAGSAWLYIYFFRATPVLVQLLFWNNITALYPRISIGIPFLPAAFHGNANVLISTFTAGVLGLGLNEGAYMAEIVRAGILAVDEGQIEAAQSIGMSRLQTMRLIVLPQAMRVIIPPTGNETISMLKTTSLVSVISLQELLFTVQIIYARNFLTIPLLLVASLWYMVVTTVLTVGQSFIERHYAAGSARNLPPTFLQRLRQALIHIRPPKETLQR
jgi:polar amino acid transport system permease protein